MSALRLTSLSLIAAAVPACAAQAQQRRAEPPRPSQFTGTMTSVTIQQRLIVRVPRLPAARAAAIAGATTSAAAPLPPIRWVEKKTDKCVPVINLAAAAVTGSDSVDLLLNGGKRLRARFGADCPALDFYSGFYVKMPKDGKVCASRDSFRARSGGECLIKSFRALVPAK